MHQIQEKVQIPLKYIIQFYAIYTTKSNQIKIKKLKFKNHENAKNKV